MNPVCEVTALTSAESLPANQKAEETAFLRTLPLFAGIGDQYWKRITETITRRRFEPGDIIFFQGDYGHVLYILKSGQVHLVVYSNNGQETSVALCGQPGDFFGELAIIDGQPRSATAIALQRTHLYAIQRDDFQAFIQQYPQVAVNFLNVLSQRIRYNTGQVNSLNTLSIPQRLARTLLKLAEDYGQPVSEGVCIRLSLTQEELASLIGASRESANKNLRDFQRQAWIRIRRKQITVLDLEGLETQLR